MAVVVVAAGCGQIESQPWDKNHDGLVGQCEGLDRFFCGIRNNCRVEERACLAICQSDGHGGCLPCAADFECVPKGPNCGALNAQQCNNDPRCEIVGAASSAATDNAGFKAAPPYPTEPQTICVERPSCALVPINSCASISLCEVQSVTVCSGSAGAPVPEDSSSDKALAPPIGGCTTTQICVNKAPATCESRSVSTCTADPECELVSGPVCEIACVQGSSCPPCATPSQTCATRHVVDTCQGRPDNQCTQANGCQLESAVCTAECKDDGHGGCAPCFAASRCIPLTFGPK